MIGHYAGGTDLWSYRGLGGGGDEDGWGARVGVVRTFPDASPEDVAVIDVHHDPLAIEGVLVYGAVRE